MSRQKTARTAADILVKKDLGFLVPTAVQRQTLLVSFARENKVLYGKAFDIVRLTSAVDLDDPEIVQKNLEAIRSPFRRRS